VTAAGRTTVAVVGGGISGLVAADLLARREHRVVLVEAGDRLGGKIHTQEHNGVVVEAGADSFLAREPWAVDLCTELGLRDRLVPPAIFGAQVWTPRGLRGLPSDFPFGIPSSPLRALRSGILSPFGALRAGAEPFLSGPLKGPDVSMGSFVRRRLGTEVLERLVDPLLAGTRAGRPDELSLAAAAPQIDALARKHRSLVLGLRSARRRGVLGAGAPPFLAPRDGMQIVVERLQRRLESRAEVRTSTMVERLEREGDCSYVVHLRDQAAVKAAAVVVAAPAYCAAELLRTVAPVAARELAKIDYASVVSITLVYDSAEAITLQGSGLLVPSIAGKTLAACSWYSKKWPHHAPGDGRLVVRCFVGRAAGDAATELGDDDLLGRVVGELEEAVGLRSAPQSWKITRWPRALPQYAVGHLDAIQGIERALEETPGVALAGAGYRGSGIPDCIKSAHAAARSVQTWIDHRA
jgi:oxygen-dependent protoporphyrinogen oxidase